MALYLVYLVGYRKTINEILWVEKMNISLDANALTFLIEAIDPQYNPLYDKQLNYLQRISTIRIFLNDGSSCGILPQVVKEVGDICEYKTRVTAEPTDEISFHKVTLQCSDLDLQKRTEELLQIHPKKNHCILLAEAEFAGIDVLLTRDELFRNRLNPLSNVEIIFPSDYLALMNMQQDTKPEFRAPESNPLLGKSWLKTQCERLRNAIFR